MANPRPDEKQPERQDKTSPPSGSARDNLRSISDAGGKIAGTAADIGQRAAQTGVEMLDKNKEVAQQFWQRSSELMAYWARCSTDQWSRTLGISGENAENMARKSSQNFEALIQSGDVLTTASRDFSQEWFETMRRVIDATVGRSESFAGCRTPNDLFAMQLELVKDSVQAALHGAKRISEISAQAAAEATEKMAEAGRRAA